MRRARRRRRGQLDGGLVLVGLLAVVRLDLVRVALLPARLALGELLLELARVEQDELASSTVPAVAWIGPRKPALTSERDEAAMVEVGVGQQDRVELGRVERERDRLRTDSFGLPWNMPQSMRTLARSVTSRNWEPVTVVAPPRKWICMGAW